MTAVTAAALRRVAPNARAALVNAIVDNWSMAAGMGINTPRRVRHFLARILVETGGLRATEESLNYTTAAQIRKTWPSRFKTLDAAKPFVRQPQKLAIKVYGGRMGNKPGPSTDGWDFRGGGMMQTTGRSGYAALGFEKNPEALREPTTAFLTAIREWLKRGCNAMADRDDVVAICKAINGGTHGLADQKEWLKKLAPVIPDKPQPQAQAVPVLGIADLSVPDAGVDLIEAIEDGDPELLKTQLLLLASGYPVGTPDGRWGEMTRTALYGFKASYNETTDDDLPMDGSYGTDVQLALIGWKRPVTHERATATVSDLKDKGDPSASVLSRLKAWALGLVGIGAAGGVTDSTDTVDRIEKATGAYSRISAALEPLAALRQLALQYWWVIAIGLGLGGYFWLRPKLRALVETYRKGLRP